MKGWTNVLTARVLNGFNLFFIVALILFSLIVLAPTPNSNPQKLFLLKMHMLGGLGIFGLSGWGFYLCLRTKKIARQHTESVKGWSVDCVLKALFYLLVFLLAGSGIGIAIAANLPGLVFFQHGELLFDFKNLPSHILHLRLSVLLLLLLAVRLGIAIHQHVAAKDEGLAQMS